MSTTLDASISPTDSRQNADDRIQSPPAFLDLADSVRPTPQSSLRLFGSPLTPYPLRCLISRLRDSVVIYRTCLLCVLHLVAGVVMFA